MESSKQEAISAPFKGCITQILLADAIQKHDAALEQSPWAANLLFFSLVAENVRSAM